MAGFVYSQDCSVLTTLSAVNIYTVPTGSTFEIKTLWVTNVKTNDDFIWIWHVPFGGSVEDAHIRLPGLLIPQKDFKKFQCDWQMADGDMIYTKGETLTLGMSVSIHGLEYQL